MILWIHDLQIIKNIKKKFNVDHHKHKKNENKEVEKYLKHFEIPNSQRESSS
jgi:hypothetical protein